MNRIEGSFKGIRNIDTYYQAWLPGEDIQAVLLIVHGLGEHSGRYMNVVNHFVPLGFAVYAFDHIGHGKSGGKREYVQHFTDYTDTLKIYYDKVKDWQKDIPVYLLGHSMGGLITSHFLLDHQTDLHGAIISAPAIKKSDTISKATVFMGKLLSILLPGMGILALDTNGLSRDPEVVKHYIQDPLVFHGKTPARLAAELLKAMEYVASGLQKITVPLIVLQGSEDKLVDPGGAQMLYDKAGSKDKFLRIYEGMYHEVFNEPDRHQVLDDVERWLVERRS